MSQMHIVKQKMAALEAMAFFYFQTLIFNKPDHKLLAIIFYWVSVDRTDDAFICTVVVPFKYVFFVAFWFSKCSANIVTRWPQYILGSDSKSWTVRGLDFHRSLLLMYLLMGLDSHRSPLLFTHGPQHSLGFHTHSKSWVTRGSHRPRFSWKSSVNIFIDRPLILVEVFC